MFCDYIKIAVANILTEHNNGIERACGSCNPSCDDLTRFICFGHTVSEIQEWLDQNPDKLHAAVQQQEDKLYQDYALYMKQEQEEERLAYAKKFCAGCQTFISAKDTALQASNSVFDAVIDVERFQRDCIKNCVKFNESFILHGREELTHDKDFCI